MNAGNMLNYLKHSISGMTLLIAIPLIVMSWHVFTFFESDPLIVRVGLAISFDILIVVLFVLLNDDLIRANQTATRITWLCIAVLISFQLYVNVWVYWQHVTPVRAIVSGMIFPLIVAPISYLASLRKKQEAVLEQREEKRKQREEIKQEIKEVIASGSPDPDAFEGQLISKDQVELARKNGTSIETFKKARNWKSVKRWWNE
jgi:hypothetical protein